MSRGCAGRAVVGLALGLALAACAGGREGSDSATPVGTASTTAGEDLDILQLTASDGLQLTASDGLQLAATDGNAGRPRMGAPVILVEDRFEGFNRAMYRFNFEVDQYVLLPIVRGYRFVVPRPVRTGISNFFSNLGEFRNAGNGVLQARPEVASRATIRFLVNSTVGVFGFFDVATRLGVDRQREDFGQTLGWWGMGAGPYLVLPIVGPSSVRDAAGLPVDLALGTVLPPGAQISEIVYSTPAPIPLQAIDARDSQPFRYYDSGSAFEYDLVRFLYFKAREAEIAR